MRLMKNNLNIEHIKGGKLGKVPLSVWHRTEAEFISLASPTQNTLLYRNYRLNFYIK